MPEALALKTVSTKFYKIIKLKIKLNECMTYFKHPYGFLKTNYVTWIFY